MCVGGFKINKIIKLGAIFLIFVLVGTAIASAETYHVGPKQKIKTIQAAANMANDGDVINVDAGTYEEYVTLSKDVSVFGQKGKYPAVYGFKSEIGGPVEINGFRIKNGVKLSSVMNNIIRNNYFDYCNVTVSGKQCSYNVIMNNQFNTGGIIITEAVNNSVTGNKITKAKVGLGLYKKATCEKISGNVFSYCNYGVQLFKVPAGMTENKYIKNKVNIKTGVY